MSAPTDPQHPRVRIVYGAVKNPRGGWSPYAGNLGLDRYPRWPRSCGQFDRDVALAMAKQAAEAEAEHYIGDWEVIITEEGEAINHD